MSTKSPNDTQSQSVGEGESPPLDVEADEEAVDERSLGPDRIFEVLKNQRRRRTLNYLIDNDNPVTIGALAEHIGALENDTTESALTSRERKRVYVGLYQCHLPKMDDTGVIDFNKARGTIELGPTFEQFRPYLNRDDDDPLWASYYLVMTATSTLAVGLNAVLGLLSATVVLMSVLCGFISLSAIHFLHTTDRLSTVPGSIFDR
ncbi:DUF7344 domain-containing protein [Halocatena halophila]|uniref:DUF7344 domain-containing protein n=1 Tax=Halocatena halophila TaxID=2814576 RepID=UPI002ED0CB7A